MSIEINGNTVVHRHGSGYTTHRLVSPERAIELAAQLEDQELADRKRRLSLAKKYSDPEHPAEVVLPAPDVMARAIQDVKNVEDPDNAVELVVPAVVDPDADFSETVDETRQVLEDEWEPETDSVDRPETMIDLEWDFDPEAKKVQIKLQSNSTDDIDVFRLLGDRDGKVVLQAGRKLKRNYRIDPGETGVFRADATDGPVIAEFTIPVD